ncbi:MAG TPA: dihydropteroate synthase [Gemmatimonadaceae bacterium]|nr:dihydropteroate synthase [Gemmatimonadaceae bacterium]
MSAVEWRLATRVLQLNRPLIMGIINVTPDSFSDGGKFFSPSAAAAHGRLLISMGADLLDIGGESTRPQGATPVSEDEELQRVIPVLDALHVSDPDVPISVDTVKSGVARAALAHGADVINDVSGFRLDPEMVEVCADRKAGVILMHSRGGVATMGTYADAVYGDDVVGEVIAELGARVEWARAAGVERERIAIDPGVGFAKRTEHSLLVMRELPRFAELGLPVAIGVSRKRFIGELSGAKALEDRIDGTTAANVLALAGGARIFRVHDVDHARRALDMAWSILGAGEG